MTYAHLFASSVNVPADEAKIPRVNPIAGNAPFEAVNGGRYAASADLLGVGAQYKFWSGTSLPPSETVPARPAAQSRVLFLQELDARREEDARKARPARSVVRSYLVKF